MRNTYKVLVGTQAFLDALHTDLDDCNRSLDAQFMTYEGDAAGLAFSERLAAKAAQGVAVRLLVDGYTDFVVSDVYAYALPLHPAVRAEHRRTQAMLAELPDRGVAVKRTAPPGWMGRFMLYRNHKKMVLIDERVAYVGGINVSDHNFAWHDFMVRIEGPLVAELVRDYAATWTGEPLALAPVNGADDYLVSQNAGRPALLDAMLGHIDAAQHTLVIESPYLFGDRTEAHLLAAAERGVQLTLITPFNSNHGIYRVWVRALRRRLDHPNIALYGYQGTGGMTHAKLLIADNTWGSFGSFNFFELEGVGQKDLNVFSTNADLIAQLRALVAADLAQSVRLEPPDFAPGRFTYSAAYRLVHWWTQRQLKDPAWRAIYC